VKLKDVKTVYSIGALACEGDLPASIFHLQLSTNDIADGALVGRLDSFSCERRSGSNASRRRLQGDSTTIV